MVSYPLPVRMPKYRITNLLRWLYKTFTQLALQYIDNDFRHILIQLVSLWRLSSFRAAVFLVCSYCISEGGWVLVGGGSAADVWW